MTKVVADRRCRSANEYASKPSASSALAQSQVGVEVEVTQERQNNVPHTPCPCRQSVRPHNAGLSLEDKLEVDYRVLLRWLSAGSPADGEGHQHYRRCRYLRDLQNQNVIHLLFI